MLGQLDPGQILLDGLVRRWLAHEQEMAAGGAHRLAHRLAGVEVVAEVDRVEAGVAAGVPVEPAPGRPALAVLLGVAVLRHDEFRLERHDALVAGRHQGGGQQGVEVLGPAAAHLRRAVRAVQPGGAEVLGPVQRDQHPALQAAELRQPAAPARP